MDKFPRLSNIVKFYSALYDDPWENYISIFHYTMLENQFLVANGNNVGTYVNSFHRILPLDFEQVFVQEKSKK